MQPNVVRGFLLGPARCVGFDVRAARGTIDSIVVLKIAANASARRCVTNTERRRRGKCASLRPRCGGGGQRGSASAIFSGTIDSIVVLKIAASGAGGDAEVNIGRGSEASARVLVRVAGVEVSAGARRRSSAGPLIRSWCRRSPRAVRAAMPKPTSDEEARQVRESPSALRAWRSALPSLAPQRNEPRSRRPPRPPDQSARMENNATSLARRHETRVQPPPQKRALPLLRASCATRRAKPPVRSSAVAVSTVHRSIAPSLHRSSAMASILWRPARSSFRILHEREKERRVSERVGARLGSAPLAALMSKRTHGAGPHEQKTCW